MTPLRRLVGDACGAFADGAVLFPLLLALAWRTGASATAMLATTGLAYLVTGWLFRLPIPVQPLKSMAIVAIASGASVGELRLAGAAIGVILLLLSTIRIERWAERVPDLLVHGFQLGLGVLLLLTARRLVGEAPWPLLGVAGLAALLMAASSLTRLPLLGLCATAGLVWSIWQTAPPDAAPPVAESLRAGVIVLLVLPQIALTLTNSVLGTERAARIYFGEAAARVTPRRLLRSIGGGNLIAALLGGMPYCHGSGGVTAHYRGGSRTAGSNAVIGGALLALAAALWAGGGVLPQYPSLVQALLLAVIGAYHLQLSAPSWKTPDGAVVLIAMGLAALIGGTMTAVLAVGVLALIARAVWTKQRSVVVGRGSEVE